MRKFRIEIDGKTFVEETNGRTFRVTFTSRMKYTDRLSFLDLGIYNLSRNTDVRQGANIILSAGYDEEFDRIFTGKIVTVLREREGANIITRILCKSSHFDTRKSIEKTVGAGGSILDALRMVSDSWGIPLNIDEKQFADAPKFITGYAMNGDLVQVMNSLAKQFNFQWLESSDALIIDRVGKEIESTPREVSLFTGLIGVPEMEGDVKGYFVNLTMRLSPRIRMRTAIELKSEFASYSTGNYYIKPPENGGKVSGLYKVVEIVHRGDSLGDKWQTEVRGQKL